MRLSISWTIPVWLWHLAIILLASLGWNHSWPVEPLVSYILLLWDVLAELREEGVLLESSPEALSWLSRSSYLRRPPTGASTTFHSFRRLPLELRLMIWEKALPGPRLVMLRPRPELDPAVCGCFAGWSTNDHFWRIRACIATSGAAKPFKLPSRYPIPLPLPMLAVNTEAREVVLNHYRPAFNFAPPFPPPPVKGWAHGLVDFERDIICLPSYDAVSNRPALEALCKSPDLEKIKRLWMAAGYLDTSHRLFWRSQGLLGKLIKHAKEIVVVHSELFAQGTVSRVAMRDLEYWVKWRSSRGELRWARGRKAGAHQDMGGEYGSMEEEKKEGEGQALSSTDLV